VSAAAASAHLVSKGLQYSDKEGETTEKKQHERGKRQQRSAALPGRPTHRPLPAAVRRRRPGAISTGRDVNIELSFRRHERHISSESDLSSTGRSDSENSQRLPVSSYLSGNDQGRMKA
jgi:hypothetical protein